MDPCDWRVTGVLRTKKKFQKNIDRPLKWYFCVFYTKIAHLRSLVNFVDNILTWLKPFSLFNSFKNWHVEKNIGSVWSFCPTYLFSIVLRWTIRNCECPGNKVVLNVDNDQGGDWANHFLDPIVPAESKFYFVQTAVLERIQKVKGTRY